MEFKTARGRLFFLLMLIAAFPFLQNGLSFYESGQLKGAVVSAPDVAFMWSGWWDGTYQKAKNLYLNDNTSCRPDLVRLNNQVDYGLFGKLHANGVVMGKDDYLYEESYIDEYYGFDFMGEEVIRDEARKIKKIQDTLERMGKTFVFMYAPSKAWYFPDDFPAGMKKKEGMHPTNYETYKRLGDSMGVHQVDFNGWFMAMKDTSKNLLFSRLGTHWTVYGSLLACDSMIKYVEKVRKIQMPGLQWHETDYSDIPQRTDNDLAAGLNLITHFKKERFSYPKYFYNYDGNKEKPRGIYIGDSFLWTWVNNGLMKSVNTDWQVWYYFNEEWNESTFSGLEPMRYLENFKWQDELLKTDCVVALYTPANFKGFNFDGSFIEKMYQYFYPVKK